MTSPYNSFNNMTGVRVVTESGTVRMLPSDSIVEIAQSTPSTVTVIGPSEAVQVGKIFTLVDKAGVAATYPITFIPYSGTISGEASQVINSNYGSFSFFFDGATWVIDRAASPLDPVYIVTNYGATGNAKEFGNFSTVAGSPNVSTTSYNFSSSDIGKLIAVFGAGAGGSIFASTIINVSSGIAICSANASVTINASATGVFGADDASAIQTAINTAQSNDYLGGVVYLPPLRYMLGSGITLDPMLINLIGNGAYLHAECMIGGPAITVNNSSLKRIGTWNTNKIEGIELIGPGGGGTTDGITFSTTNASFGIGGFSLYNVSVRAFRYGHVFTNHAYLIHFYESKTRGCLIGTYMPTGYTDYGEALNYYGGLIAECTTAVTIDNPNGEFMFFGTSFDFNGINITLTRGVVRGFGAHFEQNGGNLASSPFSVAGNDGCALILEAPLILFDSAISSAVTPFSVAQGGTIVLRDPYIHQAGNSTGALCSAGGRFIISGTRGYAVSSGVTMSQVFSSTTGDLYNANLMSDGSFENASILDYISLTSDAVAVTDRFTGTNLVLSTSTDTARTGSRSLKADKKFNSFSTASFVCMCPIPSRAKCLLNAYYSKPGAGTGTINISPTFYQVEGSDGNGIPFIRMTSTIGTVSPTFSASAVGWTTFSTSDGEPLQAPAWATHFGFSVNMNTMNIGQVYFDDVSITVL